MKISTITCALLGSILLSASSVLADSKNFKLPPRGSTFSPGDRIRFVPRDTPDFDQDSIVEAILYSDEGEFVKVIKTYEGEHDDDNLEFYYDVDYNLKDGDYYVELVNENHPNDRPSSYTFNIRKQEAMNPYMGYPDDPRLSGYNGDPFYPF